MKRSKPTFPHETQKCQIFRPSINDLPTAIFVEILLRLSTLSIVACKSVCKAWHGLISDSRFAELHLARAKTFPLIRVLDCSRVSRSVYLLEPEDGRGLDVGYCWCESFTSKCVRCCPIGVDARLKIPVRNAGVMLSHLGDRDSEAIFAVRDGVMGKNSSLVPGLVALSTSWDDHSFLIGNSCNGFLCLYSMMDPAVFVCNPVTGEFLDLPKPSNVWNDFCRSACIGFSPKNNQYKVLRTCSRYVTNPAELQLAEIHTIGTDSWRNVDFSALEQKLLRRESTYLNGALHWFSYENNIDGSTSEYLVSFDLDKESLGFQPIPQPVCGWSLGVLGSWLCLSSSDIKINIWVMKEYGVCESWTKLFSIDAADRPGPYMPLSYLNNGVLIMFNDLRNELVYYDQIRGLRFKHLRYRGIRPFFRAIAFTPSFVSLKDGKVEVQDVHSRFGKIKLLEEMYPLFLLGGKR